jgi:hypothetical protein
MRKLPISQKNILEVNERNVVYRVKDTRQKCYVEVTSTLEDFVDLLAQHVLDRYRHSVRRFGLLAPQTNNLVSAGVHTLLGQKPRPKPRRPRWANAMKRRFGIDPLLDEFGNPRKALPERARLENSRQGFCS